VRSLTPSCPGDASEAHAEERPAPVDTISGTADEVVEGFWKTAHTLDVEARVAAAKPLFWVHIPRTGSSFALAILRHKAFCSNIKPEMRLPDDLFPVPRLHKSYFRHFYKFNASSSALCTGVKSWRMFGFFRPFLKPVHSTLPTGRRWSGAGVTMLRDPAPHYVSLFQLGELGGLRMPSETQMMREWAHCQVNMIAGDGCLAYFMSGVNFRVERGDDELAVEELLDHALYWLRTRFAFVGLVEKWMESICLFHAMFGGPISVDEFSKNLDKFTQGADRIPRNTTPFEDMIPPSVLKLYEYGKRRFSFDIDRYQVDAERCGRSFEFARRHNFGRETRKDSPQLICPEQG